MPPASITKIMTLLLVMEALDAGTITLGNSGHLARPTPPRWAARRSGFEPGEQMTVP